MDADSLRALQAPLKQLYQDDPTRARVALTATGSIRTDQPACEVATDGGPVIAGLHPAAGGDGGDGGGQ